MVGEQTLRSSHDLCNKAESWTERSGKLKLSGNSSLAFVAPLRPCGNKDRWDILGILSRSSLPFSPISVRISQFFNFSFVCLNLIYPPLSSRPIYTCHRGNVLPQIKVAKVIFFPASCRRCRMACRQKWFKATFPFRPSSRIFVRGHVSSSN